MGADGANAGSPHEPVFADIEAAAARLNGHAVRTPLLESPLLNENLGGRVLIKPEMLQRTGSFKFRGAFNRVSQIAPEKRPSGVVAYSSGNHAQGVAAAAGMLNIPALIVMPKDAPEIKIANTRALGAEVEFYDRHTEVREDIAAALARDRGAEIIKPYDDPFVIAGQGTVGLEIAADAEEREISFDALLVPCGGGGLAAGCALAFAEAHARAAVFCVEPEGFDDTRRSLAAGKRVSNPPGGTSICDALLLPIPGELTFAVNSRLLAGGLSVSEDDVRRAMAAAFELFKLVVEPGGAVALAAILSGQYQIAGKTVAVVCSGGNVDPGLFREILAG